MGAPHVVQAEHEVRQSSYKLVAKQGSPNWMKQGTRCTLSPLG